MTPTSHAPPSLHSAFVHSASLHLHRYLAPWLQAHPDVSLVCVSIGFPNTATPDLHLCVTSRDAETIQLPFSLASLLQKSPEETLQYTHNTRPLQLRTLLLQDSLHVGDSPLGVALLDADTALSAQSIHTLQQRACEAIRAARRNSLRLTLEETFEAHTSTIKDTLYEVLDHLPGWLGVDHSARLLITHDPRDTSPTLHALPTYDVMAERLFFQDTSLTRLVGLSHTTSPSTTPLLHSALTTFLHTPHQRTYRFVSSPNTRDFTPIDSPDNTPLPPQPLYVERPPEGRVIFVPLTTTDPHQSTTSLLGWLRLSYRDTPSLPYSTAQLLHQLSDTLSSALKSSEIYTLSTQNVTMLRAIREDLNRALDAQHPADDFAARVVQRIAQTTQLPAFSIGLFSPDDPHTLHFPSPHGWTLSDASLTLDTRLSSSGVVGLTIRLNEPVALSGGFGPEHKKQWNNTRMVHEEQGLLLDARNTPPEMLQKPGWTPLHTYYHPAHNNTYATLAFPIIGLRTTLGVIAVEVERTTTWLWWSGLGSQLFYQLLCDQLALCLEIIYAESRPPSTHH